MMTRRATASALALIAGLLLAGCTPSEPAPTPAPIAETTTPTPTTVAPTPFAAPAPATEDEAVDAATAAYEQYLALRAQINAKPGNTTAMETIATGTALQDAISDNTTLAASGATMSGTFRFELDRGMSYAAPSMNGSGATTQYGTATLKGCGDRSELLVTRPDGSTSSGEGQRFKVEVVAVYNIDEGRWYIDRETYLQGQTC